MICPYSSRKMPLPCTASSTDQASLSFQTLRVARAAAAAGLALPKNPSYQMLHTWGGNLQSHHNLAINPVLKSKKAGNTGEAAVLPHRIPWEGKPGGWAALGRGAQGK